ncbi:MAG: S41 family peptidase [Bacteroidota bacterium]
MKFIQLILCFSFLTSTLLGQNNPASVQDSIQVFYSELFNQLEQNYLYTESVDWQELQPHILSKALEANSFYEALEMCPVLFDSIKGDHTLLFTERKLYQSTLKKELSQEQFHRNLLVEYAANPGFSVEVLGDQCGYIFIPGMLLLNAPQEELDAKAQEMYRAIVAADSQHQIKGWIIDLRLNIGGNANVMLTGLYHLLGNGTTYLELDANKHVTSRKGLLEGTLYDNHQEIIHISPTLAPNPEVPVAIITGLMTASAGEFVALGFRGRKNTLIIGEESYGLTTSNDLFELPFNTTMAITLSYGTDRSAVFTNSIEPDVKVVKEADLEHLLQDKNIIEAVRFIDQER